MLRGAAQRHNARACLKLARIVSTLYLIRHGQASFGSADYDRLSTTGREQIAHLREHLRSLGAAPDGLWCGRLRRQLHSAEILAEGSPLRPQVDAAFDEYHAEPLIRGWLARQPVAEAKAGGLETAGGTSPREYQRLLEGAGLAWIRGELDHSAEERWPAFRARVGSGLDALMLAAGRGRRIAVCTSAGVIGAAVGHVLGLDDRQSLTLSWSVFNASLTVLLFDERRASVSSFNALPHLERPELGALITYR
jgi:broad specificity phosphatase PhoE